MKKFLHILGVLVLVFAAASSYACAPEGAPPPDKYGKYNVGVYYYPGWGGSADGTFDPERNGEWAGVAAGKPLFDGHYQPLVPLWGPEDESDPKVMEKKIRAAAENGIDAFLFDWYYYAELLGTKEDPKDGGVMDGAINKGFLQAENNEDIDFAVVWCNHDMGTQYLTKNMTEDALMTMMDYVIENYFSRPNYWTIDGKPVFYLYNLAGFVKLFGRDDPMDTRADIRKAKVMIEKMRQRVRDAGYGEMHLMVAYVYANHQMDASAVEVGGLPPANFNVLDYLTVDSSTSYVWGHDTSIGTRPEPIDYAAYTDRALQRIDSLLNATTDWGIPHHPNLSMGWDSTTRNATSGGGVLVNNDPANFKIACQKLKAKLDANDQRIITVNSWNEWGEGTRLEPCEKYGYGYLWAIRDVFGD
ncbi:MAG: glycoside hydrolase family 99-like domain-containing protein [Clostridiales bacterium]|nr:glycoside hydrolase family 99-like domain-containing protein [Clostridiales bacterium]